MPQTNNANGPMHLTTMPSALLSQILRTQDLRQKQVVAGDRGRSTRNEAPLDHLIRYFLRLSRIGTCRDACVRDLSGISQYADFEAFTSEATRNRSIDG